MIFLYIGGFQQNETSRHCYTICCCNSLHQMQKGKFRPLLEYHRLKQTKSFSEENYAQDPDLLVPGSLAIQSFFNISIILCFTAASKHANLQSSCIDSSRDVLLKGACCPIDLYQQGCCTENVPNTLHALVTPAPHVLH